MTMSFSCPAVLAVVGCEVCGALSTACRVQQCSRGRDGLHRYWPFLFLSRNKSYQEIILCSYLIIFISLIFASVRNIVPTNCVIVS